MTRLLAFLVMAPMALLAQPEAPQSFTLSDIHPSQAGVHEGPLYLHENRLELHGLTMLRLIEIAYNQKTERIFGGPPWLDTDRFDVIAEADAPVTTKNFQPMLQNLLVERFHLKAIRQDRPEPVYVLLAANPSLLKPTAGGEAGCKGGNENGSITLVCQNQTMASLADNLPRWAGNYFNHSVVDKTGLKGSYDFTLQWTGRAQLGAGDSDHPSINLFTFLEKQLGIKAQPDTRPAGALTIEAVDHAPTPNAPGIAEKLKPLVTEFDVVEIHHSKPGTKQDIREQNGRIEAFAVSMKDMVGFAYNLDDYMLPPSEKWLDSDLYDVIAKTDRDATDGALQAMLQNLLATRFHFKSHFSDAPLQVWALTAPKGKGKLRPAASADRGGCVRTPKDGGITLSCRNITMEQFAAKLPNVGGASGYINEHPMVDLTGLSGSYDFDLEWAPPARVYGAGGRGGEGGGAMAGATASRPDGGLTIFEAIDKQLGLKLSVEKHKMPILVIDHIDHITDSN